MDKPVKFKLTVGFDYTRPGIPGREGTSKVTANLYLSSSSTGASHIGSVEVPFDENEYRSSESAKRHALEELQDRLASAFSKLFNEGA